MYPILIIVATIWSVINRDTYPAGMFIMVPLLLIASEIHSLRMIIKTFKLKFGIQKEEKKDEGKE